MPWLDDVAGALTTFGIPGLGTGFASLPSPAGASNDEDFWGARPGFDLADIPDFLGRLGFDWPQVGAGGQQQGLPLPTDLPFERLPGPGGRGVNVVRDIGQLLGLGNGNGNGQVRAGTTSMYIGGNCPGLWHTTPTRVVFDKNTGAARQVGGNRRSNRVSLVQDDSGALEFVAPVKATWSLKYKKRSRHHHHRAKRVRHHHHRRKRVGAGHHHHGYTAAQRKAGFAGKAAMRR